MKHFQIARNEKFPNLFSIAIVHRPRRTKTRKKIVWRTWRRQRRTRRNPKRYVTHSFYNSLFSRNFEIIESLLVSINNYYILQEVNEDEVVEEEHHEVEVEEEEEVVLPQQEQTKFRSMPVEPEPTRKNHSEMIKTTYKYHYSYCTINI